LGSVPNCIIFAIFGADRFSARFFFATVLQHILLGVRSVESIHLQQKPIDMKKFAFAFVVLLLMGAGVSSAKKNKAVSPGTTLR